MADELGSYFELAWQEMMIAWARAIRTEIHSVLEEEYLTFPDGLNEREECTDDTQVFGRSCCDRETRRGAVVEGVGRQVSTGHVLRSARLCVGAVLWSEVRAKMRIWGHQKIGAL